MGDGNGGAERSPWQHRDFYREAEHFVVKELCLHDLNIISFHLVTGRRWWHVVGCYLAPSDTSTIEDVASAIRD